ncbi:MAG: hypothetical protein JWM43_3496 [Acidobacteriaceae bacterium]|nr:hypothetical protein [Acidobacteriaceae bacterium]
MLVLLDDLFHAMEEVQASFSAGITGRNRQSRNSRLYRALFAHKMPPKSLTIDRELILLGSARI